MTPAARRLTNESLLAGTRALCERDADFAGVVARLGPPPLWGRPTGFATLVRIILEQQVSLAAARTMFLRLQSHAGGVTPETIGRLGVDGLRRVGLTRQKASYIHGLAVGVQSGAIDLSAIARAKDETGRNALLAVRGLGAWSVDIYYLMALRRPDVWPHGDLALAQAAHQVKRLRARPDHERLTRMAAAWAPWRSIAARILWHHYLSPEFAPRRSGA